MLAKVVVLGSPRGARWPCWNPHAGLGVEQRASLGMAEATRTLERLEHGGLIGLVHDKGY